MKPCSEHHELAGTTINVGFLAWAAADKGIRINKPSRMTVFFIIMSFTMLVVEIQKPSFNGLMMFCCSIYCRSFSFWTCTWADTR